MATVSFIAAALLMVCLQIDSYTALKMEITPSRFDGSQKSVSMTCNFDGREAGGKRLFTLRLGKKGEDPIVMMRGSNGIISKEKGFGDFDGERVSYSGMRSPNDMSATFLTLSLHEPKVEDTGLYSCQAFYLDFKGEMVSHIDDEYLTVEDPKLNKLELDINRLNERIMNQTREIEQMKKTVTPMIAFTALGRRLTPKVQSKQDLIFPDTDLNAGQAYDSGTGLFKAPVDGLYIFHLSLDLACKACTITAQIVHNNTTEATVTAGDIKLTDQSSTTAVLHLKSGDLVKAHVLYVTAGASLKRFESSFFTGFLAHVDLGTD